MDLETFSKVIDVKHSKHRKAAPPNRILESFEQIVRETEHSGKEANKDIAGQQASSHSQTALRKLLAKHVLSRHQEVNLVERAQQGDVVAQEMLLRYSKRLIGYYASRWPRYKDDLLQEGAIAVLEAIKTFDKSHNASFLSYAAILVKQAVICHLNTFRSSIRVPRFVHTDARKLESSALRLAVKLGRPPTSEEIAFDTQLKDAKLVQKILDWAKREVVSLDTLFAEEEVFEDEAERLFIDRFADPNVAAEEHELAEFVIDLLKRLNPRESLVVKLRVGLSDEAPLTLEEIGARLDLSKERVWQIEEAAVRKLKDWFSDELL